MKIYALLGMLLLPLHFSSAQHNPFHEAENAYANGLYQEAIDLYQQLITKPLTQHELYFNLGNAAYKKGNLVLAVQSYRRAQYLAPTDPDIRANLRYALDTVGAPLPERSRFEQIVFSLSESQWITLAIALYGELSPVHPALYTPASLYSLSHTVFLSLILVPYASSNTIIPKH